jgi:thermostable 8-oxoguanine DNA glycosylase
MTRGAVLGEVADRHCDRTSNTPLSFSVGRDRWLVHWGRFDAFGTPAYWVDQTVRGCYSERIAVQASGADLLSETLFCLLGGFGVTAESAGAAHRAVLNFLVADRSPTTEEVEEVLRTPLPGGLGRYRFPRQRAERVADAVNRLREETAPTDPLLLKAYLLRLNGIGPKTASWIVRNATGSADVAIIDIWLVRALTRTGIFRSEWRVDRHYDRYEQAFLQYAAYGDVPAGALDLCIWEQARMVGHSHFVNV